jgi:hypothetical protein
VETLLALDRCIQAKGVLLLKAELDDLDDSLREVCDFVLFPLDPLLSMKSLVLLSHICTDSTYVERKNKMKSKK